MLLSQNIIQYDLVSYISYCHMVTCHNKNIVEAFRRNDIIIAYLIYSLENKLIVL